MSAPFMQFYVADYLGDTRHLTTEQHGAYLLLLMTMWRSDGRLPNDDKKLARIAGCTVSRWTKIKPEVIAFFEVDGDEITNARLTLELEKASEKSIKRAEAGTKGGNAKALKNKKVDVANATDLLCHSSEPEPDVKAAVVVAGVREADDWPDMTGQQFLAEVVRQVGSPRLDPSKSPGLITTSGRLAAWRRDGASWEFDVIPVLIGLTRKTGPPIGTWKFFDSAIAQSIADNRQAMKIPKASHDQPRQDRPQSRRDEDLGTMLSGALVALDRYEKELG